MKILVIAPTPFFVSRGTPIRILEEALALERRGHDITIATYHIGSEIPEKVGTRIDVRRIRRWLFWYKKTEAGANWQKILLDIMLIRKVLSLAIKKRPDVLYAHIHEGALFGWLVQKLLFWRRMILVCDFHGGLTSEMASHGYLRNSIVFYLFRWMETWINRRGDIVVTSSWENTDVINRSRTDDCKAETLLDGANAPKKDFSHNEEEKKLLRKKWGIPTDKYVFVYTGALISNKGLDPMLEAIRIFLEKGYDAYFVLAGFPIEHVAYYIRKNQLEKSVSIISPLDWFDLPELLSLCDASIEPKSSSTHQASGKILQYMAAGLPVICFDRENNRKFLGEGGVYCKEGAIGLSDGIFSCWQDVEKSRERGRKNREHAHLFSWDRSAEKVENLILNLKSQNKNLKDKA